MAVNCVRYLGYTSVEQVDRLTVPDYELLMEGVRLREVDRDYRCHLQAWLNQRAKAAKKSGKNKYEPVYQDFSEFYDYQKEQEKAQKKPETHSKRFHRLIAHMRKGETNGGEL